MNRYDVIVVGGGHAGIEAAVVASKMKASVALVTMRRDTIGKMSCNPAIGGLAKGHLVKEIDALGGAMGVLIDAAGIHFKMLNRSKGPAVWSPRAQADRWYYARVAQRFLESLPNLTIIEGTVKEILVRQSSVAGVMLDDGSVIHGRSVILTTGTFLNGKIFIGLKQMESGRAGEPPVKGLTEQLRSLGFSSGRLKTGTPPRIHRDSIDYSKVEEQKPDNPPVPFSFRTSHIDRPQLSCYITYTNSRTHDVLRTGFDQSPMYMGLIQGIGPRYCPSIEDKIVRFADKERHQIFLEPEGFDNPEVYVNGFSTSLPEHVQIQAIHSVPGLEKARILRLGYAIEYDFFPTYQLHYTLETKIINNLYFAGQINGTSGYEEAAAQGLIAGINAVLKLQGKEPFTLGREESYIGVLIDDLITKETVEPYRLFTSRAEFRLLLRSDNADLRLMEKAYALGTITSEEFRYLETKRKNIEQLNTLIEEMRITPEEYGQLDPTQTIRQKIPAVEVLKRPEIELNDLFRLKRISQNYPQDVLIEVEFSIKYRGYIQRQLELVEKFRKQENRTIPPHIDYDLIPSLSHEAREKLKKIRPANLGQASRIQGVRHGDLTVLLIYLEKHDSNRKDVSRETVNG